MDTTSPVNVDEIMKKIKEDIRRLKNTNNFAIPEQCASKSDRRHSINYPDVRNLHTASDIRNNSYCISSHRRFLGAFLVKGRSLVNNEVRRYVDPIVQKQVHFNKMVEGSFNSLILAIDNNLRAYKQELDEDLSGKMVAIRQELTAEINKVIEVRLQDLNSNIDRQIDAKVSTSVTSMKVELTKKLSQIETVENISGSTYSKPSYNPCDSNSITDSLIFNKEIGESWLSIGGYPTNNKNIFDDSVGLFKGYNNILDIGTGSGLLLEKLKENGINGYGIDISDIYEAVYKSKCLNVLRIDAITHLKLIEDGSLGGVFISQVFEHLSVDEINEIIMLCHKKLQPTGHLIIAIPNITNVMVSTNLFYLDPTHRTHLHPEIVKILLRNYGFTDIEERFYNPMSDDHKLTRIDTEHICLADEQKATVEIVNKNIDLLNRILFGYRDYVVICKK
jgi:2-polyprenyl-3-methyl-5-hydroxy-6-metoxy-1,4-benzoquinol methylase